MFMLMDSEDNLSTETIGEVQISWGSIHEWWKSRQRTGHPNGQS